VLNGGLNNLLNLSGSFVPLSCLLFLIYELSHCVESADLKCQLTES